MRSFQERSILAVRIGKFGRLREPIRKLLFSADQFSHIIRYITVEYVLGLGWNRLKKFAVLVAKQLSYQNQSNRSDQSQQEQTTKWTTQKSKQIQVISVKRGKTRARKSRLVLVSHLIGWKSGASNFNQSQSVVTQNQANATYFCHWSENRSIPI